MQAERRLLISVQRQIASDISRYAVSKEYELIEELVNKLKCIDHVLSNLSNINSITPLINYTQIYPTKEAGKCPICGCSMSTNTTKYIVHDKDNKPIYSNSEDTYYCKECRKRFMLDSVLKDIDALHGLRNTNIEVLECAISDTADIVYCRWPGCNETNLYMDTGMCQYHHSEEGYKSK